MARKKGLAGLAQARGGDLNPVWGAMASGAIGTGTTISVRAFTGMDKNAELIGLGAGVAAGVALMMSPRTRAAGFTGVVVALMTNGLRFVEALASNKQKIKDLEGAKVTFLSQKAATKVPVKDQLTAKQAEAQAGGFGMVTVDPRQLAGFGAVSAEQRQLAGNGLGVVSPEVIRSLGAAGHNSMPTFQGQAPAQIVGSASGISGAFGATIFG
jgi:hypothetical protein